MSENIHDLHAFMAQVTATMAAEYERIYAKTAEDPGTAGDEGEENWAMLLRDWLPPTYHVATKGRLIGSDGRMSKQIDVLVLKPFYPPKLREKKVWLANGVAAAFECKTTLRASHIRESANRCRDMKALFARRTGSPQRELRSPLVYGILAHSHAWKAADSDPRENVTDALWKTVEAAAHPTDMIDLICLADVGCWSEAHMPIYQANMQPKAAEHLRSTFGGTWGPISTMVSAAAGDSKVFQPTGGMLAYLTQRLAWNDPSIRDLADYYRMAGLWGYGYGAMRYWPQSVLSDEVRRGIEVGHLRQHGDWEEWSTAML